MTKVGRYFYGLALGLDKLGNCILGGDPDETISARSGRLRGGHPYSWGLLAKALDALQTRHVEGAIEDDELRALEVVEKESEFAKSHPTEVDLASKPVEELAADQGSKSA